MTISGLTHTQSNVASRLMFSEGCRERARWTPPIPQAAQAPDDMLRACKRSCRCSSPKARSSPCQSHDLTESFNYILNLHHVFHIITLSCNASSFTYGSNRLFPDIIAQPFKASEGIMVPIQSLVSLLFWYECGNVILYDVGNTSILVCLNLASLFYCWLRVLTKIRKH